MYTEQMVTLGKGEVRNVFRVLQIFVTSDCLQLVSQGPHAQRGGFPLMNLGVNKTVRWFYNFRLGRRQLLCGFE